MAWTIHDPQGVAYQIEITDPDTGSPVPWPILRRREGPGGGQVEYDVHVTPSLYFPEQLFVGIDGVAIDPSAQDSLGISTDAIGEHTASKLTIDGVGYGPPLWLSLQFQEATSPPSWGPDYLLLPVDIAGQQPRVVTSPTPFSATDVQQGYPGYMLPLARDRRRMRPSSPRSRPLTSSRGLQERASSCLTGLTFTGMGRSGPMGRRRERRSLSPPWPTPVARGPLARRETVHRSMRWS